MSASFAQYVQRLGPERCFEFVAPVAAPVALEGVLPMEAGGVLRGSNGCPELLHFAPRRWLVPNPSGPRHRALTELERKGGGTLIDVEGKWQLLRLMGDGAGDILGSSVSIDGVLIGRSCAGIAIFDCPTVVVRDGTTVDCWVRSSYLGSFLDAIEGLAPLRRQPNIRSP
jgi:sarcosine oxidase gamma subunit